MKTILEYFHMLPEPYCSQAIQIAINERIDTSKPVKHIQEALSSFNFHKTPQKQYYWLQLIKDITTGKVQLIGKVSNQELAELIYNSLDQEFDNYQGTPELGIKTIEQLLKQHR